MPRAKDFSYEYNKFVERQATAAQRRNEAAQGVSTIPIDPSEEDEKKKRGGRVVRMAGGPVRPRRDRSRRKK